MLRTILDGGIRDASVVELVLAIALGFGSYTFLMNLAQYLVWQDSFRPSPSQWLYPQLLAVVVLAVLLGAATYRRVRSYEVVDHGVEER